MSTTTPALSAPSVGARFDRTTIERRELGERDVLIDIKFCGICHSDIHQVKDEWGGSIYPMVPGHEIARRGRGAWARRWRASRWATVLAWAAWSTRVASVSTARRARSSSA